MRNVCIFVAKNYKNMKIEPTPTLNSEKQVEAMQLLNEADLNFLFQKINGEYLYWDKVKHITPKGIEQKVMWQAVKIQRKMNAQSVKFGKYSFSFVITKEMQALLYDFDINLSGNQRNKSNIANSLKDYYLISSIMEEAIASSQMEGASTTRKVAKDMLRKNLKPVDKSQQMIVNNYETISKISKNQVSDLSIEVLLDIHRSITNNTLGNSADEGCFRNHNNIFVVDGISGSVAHIPPSCSEIDIMIKDLCDFANNDSNENFIHPIVKAIIIHFMLAFIHPFVDGNGRTARSLFYWYMIKKGYWISEYMSISKIIYSNKKAYEKAFLYTENDDYDLSYFIFYHLNVIKKAFEDLNEYLQRKINEQKDLFKFNGISNINERQRFVLKSIYDGKQFMFTPKELATQFNISTKSARTDLQELVEKGYLCETNLNKRAIGYVKSERFDDLLMS